MKTKYFSIRRSVPAILAALVTLCCISTAANATIFYISTTGNDITGTGTITNPWKTLYKATSVVSVSGDIIHVNSGTYLETMQISLPVGVSIEGDGLTSIIKSTVTTTWEPLLEAYSPEGTNGNQHISAIKFDGQLTTQRAIWIKGRKNFSIHDATFIDFYEAGVLFSGMQDGATGSTGPKIRATGNSIYNCIITNCATYNGGFGRGCLNIGGQSGLLIHDNIITQNARPDGQNGWPLKYTDEGFCDNVKIYNNTLTKNPISAAMAWGGDWPFNIEFFNIGEGTEIYNNNLINGAIDLNHNHKGSTAYSIWVHDNNISMTTSNTNAIQLGVCLEFETFDVIVERNIIDKQSIGIYFTPRDGDTVKNITIRNNLITNIGFGAGTGFLINFGGGGVQYYDGINVYNNTLMMGSNPTWWGIRLPSATSGYIKNLNIKNNIINGAMAAGIVQQGSNIVIDSLNIEHNDIYNNGNSNNVYFESPATPATHFVFADNLKVATSYNANYIPTNSSPLIDAGTYVGLIFSGSAPDIGYVEVNGILPIKLLDLSVTCNNGKNQLQWKTAAEINSDHFTIERSANGINFETVGTVTAAGYSSTALSYSFTDANPAAGINYYRLIMADKDKTSDYSNVVSITVKKAQTVNITSVQLSSGRNNLSIAVNAVQNEKALLMLFDVNGRNFLNTPVVLQSGLNRIDKSTGTIAKGIYYVKLVTASEGIVKNVMVTE